MTTRLTSLPFLVTDLRTPIVPSTAGRMSSSGSETLKWKGEAVWATASTPLTASSKASGAPMSSTMQYSIGWPSNCFLMYSP
jgi:hypothetical protein